jgi:hypothetical protein
MKIFSRLIIMLFCVSISISNAAAQENFVNIDVNSEKTVTTAPSLIIPSIMPTPGWTEILLRAAGIPLSALQQEREHVT